MLRAEGWNRSPLRIEPAAGSDPAGALAVFVNHSDGAAGQALIRGEMPGAFLVQPE